MARPVPIAHTDTDPLLAFASESAEKTTAAARAPLREVAAPSTAAQTSERQQTAKSKPSGFKGRPVTPTLAIAVVAVSLLGSIGLAVYNGYRPAFLAERPASDAAGVATLSSVEGPPPGTVAIASNREGVDVFIDDRLVGHTPLRLSLPAGTHALKVQNGTETRSLPLTVTSGETLSQYIELAPVPTPRVAGELEVTSNPPGADVRVDGSLKGRTPLTVRALGSRVNCCVESRPGGNRWMGCVQNTGRARNLRGRSSRRDHRRRSVDVAERRTPAGIGR